MSFARSLITLIGTLAGCTSVRTALVEECSPAGAASTVNVDERTAAQLVGRYCLRTVLTAKGYTRDSTDGTLLLAHNDTLSRYYIKGLRGYQRSGNRILAGRYAREGFRTDTVMLEGRNFTVGCPWWMCTDASPGIYTIQWVSTTGFGGRWEDHQTGIGRAVGSDGTFLPNPSGSFCARRIDAQGAG